MTVTTILSGLEACDARGDEADAIARLGFLEWVFSAKGLVTPGAARLALKSSAAQNPESAAAQAFVGYLWEATRPALGPRHQRRRARVCH